MAQYINKDALVAWIENQIDSLERNWGCSGIFGETQMAVYDKLYSFLDTLETKDVQEPKRRMTDKERIREEIERLHEEYRGKKGDADARRALRTVLFFIDSM